MDEMLSAVELAGHCNELTAWRILKEVSGDLLSNVTATVTPAHIEIKDNGGFALSSQGDIVMEGFVAPEAIKGERTEASTVWSLAASLFYLVMGCQVLNGKGGAAQQESSRLPYMRSTLPKLSELIQHCLNYHPEQRPTLQEINKLAAQQFDLCAEAVKKGPKFKEQPLGTQHQDGLASSFWPESMQLDNKTNQ